MDEQQVEVSGDDIIQSLAQQLSQAMVRVAVLEAQLKAVTGKDQSPA